MSNLTWSMARCDLRSRLALYRLGEIGEKLIGQFLGRTVDQPMPELGELTTDLRLDIVAQQGAAILLGQRLINGSAKKLADEFFANFAKAVQG